MNASRWQQLHDLYLGALELSPEARDAYLASGTDDAELRREVEEMLGATTSARGLRVEAKLLGADAEAHALSDAHWIGRSVGRYEVLGRLGRGGMGDVFRARRSDGELHHDVALKLLRTSALTPESVARFRAEQSILARLTHRSIVGLLDTGVTDEGQPYLVMPIVRGTPLVAWCDARESAVSERLDLFVEVCDAVQHAHRNLVVHRDLKPSNVLVTDEGHVQLLDFGIAKLMDTDAESPALTRTGASVMTPEYAAPEQILGAPASTAVDVYALGVILYELLSGSRPHRSPSGSRVELERAICETPPPRLATAVTEVTSSKRGTSRRELQRILGSDLQTIVAKALHKEPERRYGSVAELTEDVTRWRRSLPVRARPDTWAYRARTFARRNRAGTIAALAVVLALFGTAATLFTQSRRVRAERDRLTEVVRVLTEVFEDANPLTSAGADSLTLETFLARSEERLLEAISTDPLLESALAATLGALHDAREEWAHADTLLELAYTRRLEALGEDQPETAAALHAYAMVRLRQGAADAESLLRASVEVQRRLSEEPTRELAQALLDLSSATPSWGERRTLIDEALAILDDVCADDPICAALGRNHVATACFGRDSLEAAAVHFQEALTLLETRLPPDHPNVLTVMQNLASSLTGTGHAARAESLFTWIIQQHTEHLGPRTSRVGVNLNNLALAQLVLGRPDEALATLERALDIQREVFGPVHPRVANTAYNIFQVHILREDVDAARDALVATLEATPQDDTTRVLTYRGLEAEILLIAGEPAAARDSLLAWWDGAQAVLAETRMGAGYRFVLARALLACGSADSARAEFEKMGQYYATRGAHRREMRAAAEGGVGLCLALAGRHDEAIPRVRRAVAVYGALGIAEPGFVRRLTRYLIEVGAEG